MKLTYKYILIILVIIAVSCSKNDEPIVRNTVSMGTNIEIQAYHSHEDEANKAITDAFYEIERINQKYSTYINDNFMSELNNDHSDTIIVDEETYFLLEKSQEIFELTNGTFDAAVGNIIKLIGFENGSPHLPSHDSILIALENVGWKHIELLTNRKLIKNKSVTINFGGIAKGYAVDQAYKILQKAGIEKFMINAGGEIKCYGKDWRIGVQHPRIKDEMLGAFVLNSMGVATSGDYEKYFKKDNKRYSHIINPVTGLPSDECQSVSIISQSVIDADGLATGIFILGPVSGIDLVESLDNTECLIVDKNGKIYKSSGIGNFFKEEI